MSETITYKLNGTCAKSIDLVMNGNVVDFIKVNGGCTGWDGSFVPRFCIGKDIDTIVKEFYGTKCGDKGTSCADQIAKVLLSLKK